MAFIKKGDRRIPVNSSDKKKREPRKEGENKWAQLPAQKYVAMLIDDHNDPIKGVRRGTSRATDDPYIFLTFVILHPQKHVGRRFWGFLSLKDTALWKVAHLMEACVPDESERPVEYDVFDDLFIHHFFFYRPFEVETEENFYQGKRHIRPRRYYEIDSPELYDHAWAVGEHLLKQGKAGGGPRIAPGDEKDFGVK